MKCMEIYSTFAPKGNRPTFMWTLKPESHEMNTPYYLPQLRTSRSYYLKVTEIKGLISIHLHALTTHHEVINHFCYVFKLPADICDMEYKHGSLHPS